MLRRLQSTIILAAVVASAVTALAESNLAVRSKAHVSRPNILLVTIDTVRADHVGCYGDRGARTPTIDALAKSGLLYQRAISQVPLTWPSHASILTGTYPFHNGVQDFTGQPLSPEFRTIAQALHDHGYATAAVVSSFVLDRSWGLSRGFDHYDDAFSGTEFVQKDLGLVERRAGESAGRALSWLGKTRTKPFFLWLHFYDPHSPYDPPEPFRSSFKDRPYDGEIAYADSQVGRIVTWLKSRGLYDNTAIVVTSDHGESLGDHGEKEHGFFVYESTMRVPLVLKLPRTTPRPDVALDYPVEIMAIAPTILQIAKVNDEIAKQFDSTSLLSSGRRDSDVAYSETFYPFSSFGWSPLRGVQSRDFHYIQAPRPELYDLRSDQQEQHDLHATNPPISAAIQQRLRDITARVDTVHHGTESASNPSVQEKLRALGYVGYAAPHANVDPQKLADPKDKLSEFQNILTAADAFKLGEYERGVQLLNEVEQSDPDMYLVPFMLGEAALRKKDWQAASQHFTKALQLNPTFDQAMTAAARAFFEQGKMSEAQSLLQKAIARNDKNFKAWYELGWIQMRANPEGARQALEKVLQIQPNFALAHRDLGILSFQKQQYQDAARQFQTATDLGMEDPAMQNFLGISYSRTNKIPQAVQAYRKALNLQPEYAEAHLNLGFAYQRSNQAQKAQAEYKLACQLNPQFCSLIPK